MDPRSPDAAAATRRPRRQRPRSGPRRGARASWRPATFRASCCSPTGIRLPGIWTPRCAHLIEAHIPVSVEPLAPRSLGDTWIDDRSSSPNVCLPGAAFTATVTVGSQRDCEAVVELRSGGKVIGSQSVAITRGSTRSRSTRRSTPPGAYVLQASLKASGDPLSENNTLVAGIWADPRTKVLYVEGTPASAKYLSGALTGSGFEVTSRPASGLPGTEASSTRSISSCSATFRRAAIAARGDDGVVRVGRTRAAAACCRRRRRRCSARAGIARRRSSGSRR